jgi:hypothetical protein
MTLQSAPAAERPAWSVELFERFWANPNPDLVPAALTDDVVGHWAGRDQPVHGKEAYTGCIAALVDALPGLLVTVAEYASNGEFRFIRWILHANGDHGPFELSGIDRVRTRDGLVAENRIVCDTAEFKARSGKEIPWR